MSVSEALIEQLLAAARQAREAAYAPYSGFKVGAAVLAASGRIYPGCNIENASFGATVCAERVAVFTAVAAGDQQVQALALVADTPEPITPCGLCRQVVAEFNPACLILMANLTRSVRRASLADLLPQPFYIRDLCLR